MSIRSVLLLLSAASLLVAAAASDVADAAMKGNKEAVRSLLQDRKSTRLNSSHSRASRMPSSA